MKAPQNFEEYTSDPYHGNMVTTHPTGGYWAVHLEDNFWDRWYNVRV